VNVNGFLKTIFQLQKAYQANIWKITEAHKVSKVQLARFAKRSPHFHICDAGITTKAQRHAAVFVPGLCTGRASP